MKYYVISATHSEDCPISFADNAVLYMDKTQVSPSFEHGYLPWYNYQTRGDFELPDNAILVSKNKKIDFTIRSIDLGNLYIVESDFKDILEKYLDTDFKKVSLVDKKLNVINKNKEYYLFKLDIFLEFDQVFNLAETKYSEEDSHYILKQATFNSDLNQTIFKIKNLDSAQDTIFIDEQVKIDFENMQLKGIRIVDASIANWRYSDDFEFMFLSESEVNELIWPV